VAQSYVGCNPTKRQIEKLSSMNATRWEKVLIIGACVSASMIPTAVGFAAPEECWQPWYNHTSDASVNDQCPYGLGLPGSVTWNTNMNPVRRFFNVFYGYISYVLPMLVGVNALIKRGTRELLFIGSIGVASVVNEYGLKNIVLEPKPLGACAITCGMPSGHSMTTVMYYVLVIVDYASRVIRHEQHPSPSVSLSHIRHAFSLMSNSNVEAVSSREFFVLAFLWAVPLLPVPFSRVDNYDHTVKQVVLGAIVGAACGLLTFGTHYTLARTLCQSSWQWPREKKWYLLQNTIPFTENTQYPSLSKEVDCEVGAGQSCANVDTSVTQDAIGHPATNSACPEELHPSSENSFVILAHGIHASTAAEKAPL